MELQNLKRIHEKVHNLKTNNIPIGLLNEFGEEIIIRKENSDSNNQTKYTISNSNQEIDYIKADNNNTIIKTVLFYFIFGFIKGGGELLDN